MLNKLKILIYQRRWLKRNKVEILNDRYIKDKGVGRATIKYSHQYGNDYFNHIDNIITTFKPTEEFREIPTLFHSEGLEYNIFVAGITFVNTLCRHLKIQQPSEISWTFGRIVRNDLLVRILNRIDIGIDHEK